VAIDAVHLVKGPAVRGARGAFRNRIPGSHCCGSITHSQKATLHASIQPGEEQQAPFVYLFPSHALIKSILCRNDALDIDDWVGL